MIDRSAPDFERTPSFHANVTILKRLNIFSGESMWILPLNCVCRSIQKPGVVSLLNQWIILNYYSKEKKGGKCGPLS